MTVRATDYLVRVDLYVSEIYHVAVKGKAQMSVIHDATAVRRGKAAENGTNANLQLVIRSRCRSSSQTGSTFFNNIVSGLRS